MKSFHKQLVPHTAHVNLVDFGLKSAQIVQEAKAEILCP